MRRRAGAKKAADAALAYRVKDPATLALLKRIEGTAAAAD